jgi:penicillin-binding protein A
MRQLAALGLSLSAIAVIAYHARSSHSAAGSLATSADPATRLAIAPQLLPLPFSTMPSPDLGRARSPEQQSLVTTMMGVAAVPRAAAAAALPPLPADPALGISLDLGRAVLRDGRYEIDLDRRRRAQLTLDPLLQAAAEKLLNQAKAPRAAAIVMSMDGRILALAGRRTESQRGGKDGISDFRLATEVWAPAASIFKLVTATALVRAGVTPSQKVCFHGGIRSVMESNLTDSPRDNRCEDLRFAVAHSQNAIIAKLTHQHLSTQALIAAAKDLGVAGLLGKNGLARDAGTLDLPADNGVALAKAAAGFQGSQLSVLGGGILATTLANRGVEVLPTIVSAVVDENGTHTVPGGAKRRVVDAKVADAVADMMVGTCEGGSAAKSFRARDNSLPKGLKVAGKTGTISRDEPFPMEYSWFVGFAPADDPKVAVAVLIGNTDLWWLKGHTVARELFETALVEQRIEKQRRQLEEQAAARRAAAGPAHVSGHGAAARRAR